MLREALYDIEANEGLDRVSAPIRAAVRPLVSPRPVRNLLSGTWLGHRLHPALTDLVIGSFMSAAVLDAAGGEDGERSADLLVGVGIAAALPTAASGLNDWVELAGPDQPAQRSGLVHAAANTAGLALYAGSLAARASGLRRTGKALSFAGLTVMSAGAHLGGHLAYRLGAGVDHTAFEHGPDEWERTVPLAELTDGEPYRAEAGGRRVLLVRDGSRIHALADTCSHAGCSLSRGEIRDGSVVCACHGSTFRLEDGSVVRGPAASPQPLLATRVSDGVVEVREELR